MMKTSILKWVPTLFTVIWLGATAFAQEKIPLHFNDQGTFKIVQFTDIHYIAGHEKVQVSLDMMQEILDREEPQLVVLTGDIVVRGDCFQGWDDILAPIIERKIPWAVCFGNHDDEFGTTRSQIMDYLVKKPFCVAHPGPQELKGVGNYVLEILDKDQLVQGLLYCMDSNTYATIEGMKGYGWFGFDQIAWYRRTSESYTQNNDGTPLPAIAFFHIPLNEYVILTTSKDRPFIGQKEENECPGAINTGMFAAMAESGDVMGTFVGHDHVNDYIGVLHGIALAYGRFSGSETTYSLFPNGARVIELTQGERTFESWIRLKGGDVILPVAYPKTFEELEKKSSSPDRP